MITYGRELIVDVHDCDAVPFTRKYIARFCDELCRELCMKKGDLHFWDYKDSPEEYAKAPPHLKGISVVQFISTSNITIHALDDLRHVYFNIFSCKEFDVSTVRLHIEMWTQGTIVSFKDIIRK